MAKFGDAFKAARSAGKKTFKWQGKTYHTKTKDEMAKTTAKSSVPVPKAKPTAPAASDRAAGIVAERKTMTGTGADRASGIKAERTTYASRDKQDYPRPAKAVGIARAGSGLSKIVARKENAPAETKQKRRYGKRVR